MSDAPKLIAALREEVGTVPPADLPSIIALLEGVKAEAWQRMVIPSVAAKDNGSDEALTVEQVAEILKKTPRWVKDHRKDLPVLTLPGRGLLFSSKRLRQFMKDRSYA